MVRHSADPGVLSEENEPIYTYLPTVPGHPSRPGSFATIEEERPGLGGDEAGIVRVALGLENNRGQDEKEPKFLEPKAASMHAIKAILGLIVSYSASY